MADDAGSSQHRSPIEWVAWARDTAGHLDLPPTEAHVLTILASYAGRAGTCYPSLARIANDARRGRTVTSNALTVLRGHGLVARTPRGIGRTCLWALSGSTAHRGTADRDAADRTPVHRNESSTADRTQNQPEEPSRNNNEKLKEKGGAEPGHAAHRTPWPSDPEDI